MKHIHFCGGLPRAGSTILMNILQQNPKIFTTGTCALYGIIKEKLLVQIRENDSFLAMSSEQADIATYGLIQGGTKGWFEALTNKPIVISKRHGWASLLHLFPNSKFICMIRDLRDIVESFERVNKKFKALQTFNNVGNTIGSMHKTEKYAYYFTEPNILNMSLNQEIIKAVEIFNDNPKKVLFLKYEEFTSEPLRTLEILYNFLDMELFDHDLNNIDQSFLYEHDHSYFRERTSHETLPSFRKYTKPKRTLHHSFHEKVVQDNLFFYQTFYPEVINN